MKSGKIASGDSLEPSSLRQLRYKDIMIVAEGTHLVGFNCESLEVADLGESEATDNLKDFFELNELSELDSWMSNPGGEPSLQQETEPVIRQITLNVTQVCNLQCSYCAAGGDGSYGDPVKRISLEKTLPQLFYFIDKLHAGESFKINFIGGEPLLYLQGIEIICEQMSELANKKNIQIEFSLTTNGTLLTAQAIEVICSFKINIIVSLDGPSEINDLSRQTKGKMSVTQVVLDNLKLFLERKSQTPSGFGRLGLSAVFGAHSRDVLKVWRFFESFGREVDWYDFNFDHTEKSEAISNEFLASYQNCLREAFAQGGEAQLRKIRFADHMFYLIDNRRQVRNFCGIGRQLISIDSRNQIYPCPWMVGDASKNLGSGTRLDLLGFENQRREVSYIPECHSCWAKNLCGGGCQFMHQENSTKLSVLDENFCYRMRSLIASVILVYYKARKTVRRDHEIEEVAG